MHSRFAIGAGVRWWPERVRALVSSSYDIQDIRRNESPDAVTIHSYRHRYGNVSGDAAFDERRLAAQPPITVPTNGLEGEADGVGPPSRFDDWAGHFTSRYERRLIPLAGHSSHARPRRPWSTQSATWPDVGSLAGFSHSMMRK